MLVSFPVGLFSSSSSIIKSVQNIAVTIAASATTGTTTITSVTTANTVIFYGGITGAHTTYNTSTDAAGLTLTSSTVVTATRNTSDASNALTVNCSVVEFQSSAIQSIQSGTTTMTASTSQTSTITSVTTANAVVVFAGFTGTYTGQVPGVFASSLQLTNSTTVTATRNTGTNNITVYWFVLEFKSGILNSSTQANSITLASGATTGTATITSVTASQAMLVWNGYTTNHASYDPNEEPWITLTNGTTVTVNRTSGSGTASLTQYFSVIEFKSANINSLNRGSITIATSAAANTATIAAVNTAKTIANWLGKTNSVSTTTGINGCGGTLTLTNSTTLTAARTTADASSTELVSYEAIEFT